MIKILTNSNILDVNSGIISHQVNCKGVMGAGLAKQIRAKYPIVYKEYLNSSMDLGKCEVVAINRDLSVANLFGQNDYGRYGIHTSYSALGQALQSLFKIASKSDTTVHIPYGIGCGLAGGNWDKVYDIIKTLSKNYNINILIHKL